MNYNHDFHAGNFADVFKHIVLTRILLYLRRKPSPFRVIDTHAGSGRYNLGGEAATRTLEWRGGIGRFDPSGMNAEARALVEPYAALVDAALYPGSPAIALALMRPFDRATFCEVHPTASASLKAGVGRDKRAKVVALDGYMALNAFIPPVERRGLVLIDPPFEAEDEFDRLIIAIRAAHAKWRDGIIMAWHPIKDRRGVERIAHALADVDDGVRLELRVAEPDADGSLAANGLFILNPPYTLETEMACLLPELARQLGAGHGAAVIGRIGRTTGGRGRA